MAISVDTVYQRVLALANKEQRGYITPQEFNLLANQAQIQIFETYFYSKNLKQLQEPNRTNEVDETDIQELIDRKLAPFQSFETVTSGHTFPATVGADGIQYDVFQTGMVFLGDEPCQKVSMHDAQRLKKSTRHMASTADQAPFYTDNRLSGRDIIVYAGSTSEETSNVTVECFRVPKTVNWAYVVVNGKAMYNSTLAVDFELHKAETDTVVYKILELAGIVLNKPGLVQIAAGKEASELAIQKIS
mgnify:CR=1 FL=1|tara:strand:+ start:392 stop:1129 length:738 start_codon:yes stop_codon:yes gene_type:complete